MSLGLDHPAIDLAPHMEAVARHFLGDPNPAHSKPGELRWGSHGSMSVDLEKGVWCDHEAAKGGGVLDLVMRQAQLPTKAAAADYLREAMGLPLPEPVTSAQARPQRRTIATYDYPLPDGTPHRRVIRTEPKGFYQQHWDGRAWRNGKGQGASVLYRMPDLDSALASVAHRTVFICEGEACADAMWGLGLFATTAAEGAGKWLPALNPWFAGRDVFVLADNDEVGEKHAQHVASNLHGIAASVRVVRLPGLPPKGDVVDWLAAGGDKAGLIEICQAQPMWSPGLNQGPAAETPDDFSASAPFTADQLKGREIVPRLWNVPGLVPSGTVTTVDGDGGTGKSTLALQLAVATVIGMEWLNRTTRRGRVLYLSAEDDTDELHRRLREMCAHFDIGFEHLADLKIWPLAGREAELIVTDDRTRRAAPTDLWVELQALVTSWQPVLVVLDSRADFYGADEINRNQVRQFVSMLRRLGLTSGAGIVLLSHPSLSGMSSGSGSSGSTAWNNSVRSRLYLSKPPPGDDHDPDLRLLSLKKANYAPEAADLRLQRRGGVFVTDDKGSPTGLDAAVQRRRVDGLFLDLLTAYTAQGRRVSDQPGANYAPALFARDSLAKGVTKPGFIAAMNRLFAARDLKVESVGPASKLRRSLVISVSGGGR